MSTYIRSYAETNTIQRRQVYKVLSLTRKTAELEQIFGKFAGNKISVPRKAYDNFVLMDDFIPVQPMRNLKTGELTFVHETLGCYALINWVTEFTSGTMSVELLADYTPAQL